MKIITWLFGGGHLKYRVAEFAGSFVVQMKGGGMGWRWRMAVLSVFSKKQAEIWAQRWARESGGTYISQ